MQYICETYVRTLNFSPIHEKISLGDDDWSTIEGFKFNTDNNINSAVSDLEY